MVDDFDDVQVFATEARRKTLSVEVHPTGQVIVRAPLGCSQERIQAVLIKRERWIAEQKAFFQRFEPRTPQRAWVMGESHLHLGRRYKLRIEISTDDGVTLSGTDFLVKLHPDTLVTPEVIETQVLRWRHEQAKDILGRQLGQCHRHYRFSGFVQPALRVQQLVKRWGSLSRRGTMTLYSGLIQAPAACIDYVIYHELCHLVHPDHSESFFSLLTEVCPQWVARKQLLEATIR
ncbi:SprT family zinc-dependent metalloprotease [Polaromonas sp. SM01]|uniref:M48 family metallopeptidase n=1 Tax=Polaromonas sp. SM01 TaxID=3085630 RepID=UPI0029819274|nr:SprT family zinc-dependent metalloprotease [Polaromonas sp. SM01]MDW5441326.1 SprT family zinc-dependent metalloprotease [Polaromonas sp. SM01]